ncbi:nucleolar DEAD-box protein required for synthesis of 60S ribosomal subunit [Dipsacomyces acuminosporus]|nr:nucleolar DEAD-box protein required for synthesis of 60S ribosomal subunit [Dipsacomyces acuminosporus]
MSTADDFIMTINDDDEVPDLEETLDQSDEEEQRGKIPVKKRKANTKDKNRNKKTKRQAEGEAGDMASGFMIDLDNDGLDSVPQTLDFTLARASLKKRNNPGAFSSLDEKIAASRRAAKVAKKLAKMKEQEEEEEEEEEMEAGDSNEEEEDKTEAGSDSNENSDGEEGNEDEQEREAEDSEAEDSEAEDEKEEEQDAVEEDDSESESEDESESETESESEVSSDDGSESEVDEVQEARKRAYFAPESEVPEDLPESFTLMNLSRQIMKGLTKLGFEQPTPIQAKTIPVALLGKDVCGGAQTGSGKTAAFLVPILERLLYRPKNLPVTRVLILCPTRELAIQCHNVGTKLAGFTDISMCLCVGGLQEGRLVALEQFRDGHVNFLMATDLAARGLDVKGIETVINYTMPTQFAQYLHRVGRTARAGRSGRAVTLVGENDRKMLKMAVKHSAKDKIKQRVVPGEVLKKYRAKVDDLAQQVADILAEEKQERLLKDAEMQVTKATNILEHKEDIKNRPRRTWFQTTKQRTDAKKAAKAAFAEKNKSGK